MELLEEEDNMFEMEHLDFFIFEYYEAASKISCLVSHLLEFKIDLHIVGMRLLLVHFSPLFEPINFLI